MMQYPLFEEEQNGDLTPNERYCKKAKNENQGNDSPEDSPREA